MHGLIKISNVNCCKEVFKIIISIVELQMFPPLCPVCSYWLGSGEPSRCRGDYRQECDNSLQLPCRQQTVAGSRRDLPYSQPTDAQITGNNKKIACTFVDNNH